MKEEYEESHPEMEWDSNKQGVHEFFWLPNGKLDEMLEKTNSYDVMNWKGQGNQVGLQNTQIMRYTGGMIEYKILNSCNHQIEVLCETWAPRRIHDTTVIEAAIRDYALNDTITNGVTPSNVERTYTDYGRPLLQPNKPDSYVNHFFKCVQKKWVTLAVGESLTYTVRHPAFTYDPARARMYLEESASEPAQFSTASRNTTITCRSQLVVDATGTKIAHGSGKVAIAMREINYARANFKTKRYQTYAHGGLDYIAEGDQFHYNVDTETLDQLTES